jgi:adenylosuccinate lyase
MGTAQERILAITSLDGRYADELGMLPAIVSEHGLIKRQVEIEIGWLATLGGGILPDIERFSDNMIDFLNSLAENFSVSDSEQIKVIEKKTKHNSKAIRNWLQTKLMQYEPLAPYLEIINFGVTGEDINDLAYAMQIRDIRDQVIIPELKQIGSNLEAKNLEQTDLPVIIRTPEAIDSPSTLGKEMHVFAKILQTSIERIGAVAIYSKFNSRPENLQSMTNSYPEVDWPIVINKFVHSMGFKTVPSANKIEYHDWAAIFFTEVASSNSILADAAKAIYSFGISVRLTAERKQDHLSDSTVAHENYSDFKLAETDFGIANVLLAQLASIRSRGDLDSSSLNQLALGEAFGYTVLGHRWLNNGLSKDL